MRSAIAGLIHHAGVYNCRKISGSSTWSQHAWGNGDDLFPYPDANYNAACKRIAEGVVLQARKRTIANRGRKCAVYEVIDHQNMMRWTRAAGWKPYGGTHGPHVHVGGDPLRTGVPPCA
jgi:hypothetical protein